MPGIFEKRLKNVPSALWHKITEIERHKGTWSAGAKLNPQILKRLKKNVLITSTGASTRIEGAKLTDEDIEKYIKGISIQPGQSTLYKGKNTTPSLLSLIL